MRFICRREPGLFHVLAFLLLIGKPSRPQKKKDAGATARLALHLSSRRRLLRRCEATEAKREDEKALPREHCCLGRIPRLPI